MVSTASFTFAFPAAFWCAVALTVVAAAVAVYRRPAIPALTSVLAATGLLQLALAAGGLTWHRPAAAVVVMVDLSASTRTAQYRDAVALRERVRQLLGDVPHRMEFFADAQPSRQQADELRR